MQKSLIIRLKNKILELISPLLLRIPSTIISDFDNYKILYVKKENFKYLTHSSFNVVQINNDKICGFFRECRIHSNMYEYLETILNDYCHFVSKNKNILLFKDIILRNLSLKSNLKKFYCMGVKNDINSPVSKFFKNNKLTEKLGITNFDHYFITELESFIQYAWGEIYLYNMSYLKKENELQTFNSSKQIATYIIAKYLELENIIPYTRMVKINVDGIVKIGTLMDVASGQSPELINDKIRHKISPNLQMQFIQLNLLDIICRQTDHRPGRDGNYNIQISNTGESKSVCAFDNDSPTSFFISSKINFTTSASTTPFIDRNGNINRPFLCKETCEKIKNINLKVLEKILSPYLSRFQLFFLKKRIITLNISIEKSQNNKSTLLLNKNEWNNNTVSEELLYCKKNNEVSYLYSYYNLL